MAFTRPKAAQIDFDITNISDPLIRLNSAETGSADKDVGIVIERGDDTNVAMLYDESADQFVLVNTTETGTTSGNVTIASYAGLQANAIIYGSLNDGTTTLTSTVAELNHLDGVTGIALGNANELVIVDSDGTGFASSSTLSIDDGNNYIGINQTSPEVTLHMTGDGTQTAQIRMEQHNDTADAPDVRTRRSRGTAAAPSNLNAGDYLFRINAEAYESGTYNTKGSIQLDTSTGDVGKGVIQFQTHNGTSLATRLQILDTGAVRFNSAYTFPTADGSANRVLATDGSGTLSFVDQSGGISNIVEDTTPQLGGNLDTNSNNILIDDAHFIADENTNEQIVFQTTASAVNSFQITNAATGNAIELASVGGDTNIGMNLVTKGSGEITLDTLAVSDLTAGRIPYIGTSGAITDAANLAWNNTGGNDSNGLLTAQNITVNNRLAGGGSGFQFFAFNEDTVDVKFANWYSTSDHQYGMGMLYYETYFAALEDTDVNLDQQRRFGFYLETPDNGASDTAGSASTQGTNYRLAITRDSLRLNNANPIRMYENNSGAVGTNYIELDWPASITSNAIINVPAVAGHLAVLGAAPTETITSTPAELNKLDGVTATTAELNILAGVTSTATELNLLDGITGITLGSANETLIVDTDGNSITTTDLLAFDTGNNRVGIGTTSPATKFHIAGEGSANEGQIRLQQAYDGTDGPDFAFYASRGTIASPTSTANNDTQGRINAYVHNGTNFVQSGSFGWSSDGTDGDNTFDIRSRVGGTLASRIEVVASGDIEFQDGAFDVDVKSHDGTNGLKLGGTLVTASAAELNYVDGVTSAIQTQLDGKLALTGGAMTGAITTNSTFDGRDVATDGTKLDGIEAGADVTDTTNVTAAGALMDSEVTNLAQVKAFDSSDYATAAQGTTADAALPKAGGTMSGAIAMGTSKITGMGDPTSAQDAATKAYVDSNVSSAANDATITITASTGLSGSASFTTDQSSDETITLAIDSTVTTLTGSQTLTNKTLTTPVISSISNTGTLTLPTDTDTLIGRATTDTLTNKSISGGDNTLTNIPNSALSNSSITVARQGGASTAVSLGGTITFNNVANETTVAESSGTITIGLADNVTIPDLTVSGNLTVSGTTTTLSTTNSVVSDSLIELNNGAGSNANDLGIVMERGSTGDNAIFAWDESADAFVMGTTTATGASTGDLTIANGELRLDTLRIDQTGAGLRMTNVGAFDNDGSDNFRIFATNDLQLKANGDSGGGLSIDVTNNDVTIDNDLRVSAGQFYYGGTAVTSTAAELNVLDGIPGTLTATELGYVDGVTSAIQTQLDGKVNTTGNNTITSTTSGSSAAPEFELFRDITGADANYIGQIKFSADNDADQKTVFAKITGKIGDASDGSEDGIIEIAHQKAGSQNIGIRITSTEFKILNGMDFDVETHDGSSNGLRLANTLVTATATELNLLDGVTGTLVTEAGTQTLTNKTLTAPVISSISNTGTLTLPTSTGTVALTSDIPTNNNQLTNGAGYITGYTVTESDVTTHQAALSITESQISDLGSYITASSTDTLTNKTLGATTVAGNIIPDTDSAYDLGSSSAKFRDLYLSGSSLNLDAFSIETHASGITFNHSSNTTLLPVGGGSHEITTLTATQTLTNKTLTSPTINGGTFTGAITSSGNIDADNFNTDGLKVVDNNIQSTRSNDDILMIPNGTGSVVINGSRFPTGLGTDGYVLTTDGAGTLTWAEASGGGQTAGHTIQNAGSNLTARAGLNFDGTYLIATDDSGNSQTDITISSTLQTIAGITFPSGAVIGSSDTQTLTNKTVDSASNTLTLDLSEGTLTGTTAEFNTALSDDSFATLTNTVTLTNKTLTSPTITGASLTSPTVTTALTLNAQADLRFADSDSSHYVGFKAPATVTANNIWTLPAEDGSNTQVLTTNGSGVLSWTDGGGGGGASTLGGLNDVTIASIATNDLIVYTGSGFENKAKHEVVPTVDFTKRDGTQVLIELTNAYDTTTILGYMNDRVSQKYRMAFTDSSGTSHTTLQTGLDSVPELSNARNIGGVSFNGSVDIDLPGVNTAGNQDTSGTAAIGTSVTVSANNTANETVYLTFVDGATGTQGIETDTGLTYNPSTGNLGASIFTGTATSAQYADLAEMYATDEAISAGTVVMFAGAGKVKPCNDENCRRVAGIVSTDPAYLMNSTCEGVPLAISGRVPCRVTGPVEAGDLMVSAGNGMAMTNNDAKSGTIIGKAIEENVNGEGIIEILAMMM